MKAHELFITPHAAESFRDIIARTQEVSLIAAEKLRQKLLHKMHYLLHHPEAGTRSADLGTSLPEVRSALVTSYRIFFYVKGRQLVIVEILLDKEKKSV